LGFLFVQLKQNIIGYGKNKTAKSSSCQGLVVWEDPIDAYISLTAPSEDKRTSQHSIAIGLSHFFKYWKEISWDASKPPQMTCLLGVKLDVLART